VESCRLIEEELVPFHFGTCTETVRSTVEAHLSACAGCLRAYLAVKRAVEAEAEAGPRPSEAARARLRRAVAQRVGRRRALVVGGALAAVIAALLLLLGRGAAPPAPSEKAPALDSARPEPANLNFL
jgi:hypothetical protein